MHEISGNPPLQDLNWQIARAISAALHAVRKQKSRAQVAEELTARVGREISVAMLNEFTRDGTSSSAGGKAPKHFPAAFVGPFCEITGDDSLLRVVAGADSPAAVRNQQNREIRKAREALRQLEGLVNGTARPRRGRAPTHKAGVR